MNLRQLMRLLINDLLMAVVICDNRATRMCPSAMRFQAASAFIASVSATYVHCCETKCLLICSHSLHLDGMPSTERSHLSAG
jgi:hypothetical protein